MTMMMRNKRWEMGREEGGWKEREYVCVYVLGVCVWVGGV